MLFRVFCAAVLCCGLVGCGEAKVEKREVPAERPGGFGTADSPATGAAAGAAGSSSTTATDPPVE